MKFLLYHDDNPNLADYARKYSGLNGRQTEVHRLPDQNRRSSFARLPGPLRRLLFFAKPDLVVCIDDDVKPVRPIFAVELSHHVPARDHWMQRFVNLVGCAQEGVPGAYIMPLDLPNHETFPGEVDPLFFFAYDRVMEIHQTPFYIAEWESEDGATLNFDQSIAGMPDHESKGIKDTMAFLDMVVESAVHGRDFSSLIRERLFIDLRNKIRSKGYKQIPKINDFKRLTFNMKDGKFLSHEELKAWVESKGASLPPILPDRIVKRDRNLIFVPQSDRKGKSSEDLRRTLMARIKEKGGDPYLGQPLAFDYIFCRLGPTAYERDANVVIDLSVLKFSDMAKFHRDVWSACPLRKTEFDELQDIPQYTLALTEGCPYALKNFLRVYAFTADIILFQDGLVYF